jgi:hypothetical protein
MPQHSHPLHDNSPFPHHLGGRRTRRPVCFVLSTHVPPRAKNHAYIAAYTIRLTWRTSAQYSLYSPNMALRPSSLSTRTSGRDTPAGPARPHGRLSTSALTSLRSRRAVRRGYAGCVAVDIRRPSAGYGRAGIRSSQPRRWREDIYVPGLSFVVN